MAINGSINLMKYVGARKVSLGGQKGVFIPVEENPTIYAGEKGVYAHVRIVEHESEFDGKKYTHFIAASLDKETRQKLEDTYGKEATKAYTPILGSATDYKSDGGTYEEAQEDAEEDDDLPFGK